VNKIAAPRYSPSQLSLNNGVNDGTGHMASMKELAKSKVLRRVAPAAFVVVASIGLTACGSGGSGDGSGSGSGGGSGSHPTTTTPSSGGGAY
jgi:hypothetical protein